MVVLAALLFAVACRKKELASPNKPNTPDLSNEIITITNAKNKSFYPLSSGISFDAKISGSAKDYSFLKGYIIDTVSKITLATAEVNQNGSMHFDFSPKLPDMYKLQVVAANTLDTSEVLDGPVLDIYAGEPPPPDTILLSPDEKSITLTWSKSVIPNFTAYELYVTRTDTSISLSDSLPGKLIATISDINDTSFVHHDVYFFYHYRYHVRVVSDEGLKSVVQYTTAAAGRFVDLSRSNALFDETRTRFYSITTDENKNKKLVSIDPETLIVHEMVSAGDANRFFALGENNSSINIVKATDYGVDHYQLYKFDLASNLLQEKQQFSFGKGQIVAVFNNYIIYHGMTTVPPYSYLATYNLTTKEQIIFKTISLPVVNTINNNNGFVVTSQDPTIRDTFYVFQMTTAGPEFVKSGIASNIYISDKAIYGNGFLAIGGSLFDADLRLLNNLPGDQVYTGISSDGQYAVTSDNAIYDIADNNVVHRFGDGFPGTGYFSQDNNQMFFVSGTTLGGNESSRIFRYSWK